MTLLEQYKARVAEIRRSEAQPLIDRLAELNTSIEKKDAEIKAEREERSEIMVARNTRAPCFATLRACRQSCPSLRSTTSSGLCRRT